MADIKLNDLENKIIQILNSKKEDIYKELLNRLNYEDRRLNLIERIVRIEDELKNQRELIEKVLHQMDKRFELLQREMDKRFEHVDKRFNLLTWVMGIGFTIITSLVVTVLNFVLK